MAKIDFNERSFGDVSDTFDAFSVVNRSSGPALRGESTGGFTGIFGTSLHSGIVGTTSSTDEHEAGVVGNSAAGTGVLGKGVIGVHGNTDNIGTTPETHPARGAGVWGEANHGFGVYGTCGEKGIAGIFKATGPESLAGRFEGNVVVTGDIILENSADCAEDFDIADIEQVEPGSVMVLENDGALGQSQRAYDRRVAGVLSGAGGYKPGITLDKQQSSRRRLPVALLGKVYCKVDAGYLPIDIGDLLTTSPTPGHAMKAGDQVKAFGCVIGKALRSLKEGRGMIPILVALQ